MIRTLFIAISFLLACVIAFPYAGFDSQQEYLRDNVPLYERFYGVRVNSYRPAVKVPILYHRSLSTSSISQYLQDNELGDLTVSSPSVLAKRAITVERWSGLGDGTNTHPTFKQSLGVTFKTPDHQTIRDYAQQGYHSMMQQGPRKDKATHLMAALYVPKQGVYLCSVPDRPGIDKLKSTGSTEAPAWWSQIQGRQPLVFHAEDCAAYLYESALKTKLAPGARYPTGSCISVYGTVEKKTADWVNLCSGGGKRPIDPSCTTVFKDLGVEPIALPTAPGPAGTVGPTGHTGPTGTTGPAS